jgi:hypothetical protein
VVVLVDGGCLGGAVAVLLAAAVGVVVAPLADVPPVVVAVVGAEHGLVDLLPPLPADVVDEETRPYGVVVDGEPEGVPEALDEGLLAVVALLGAGDLARGGGTHGAAAIAVRPAGVRVVFRDGAVGVDAQDLGEQDVVVAGDVVLVLALGRLEIVAGAVADADVELAVLAEVQVAAVVVAVGGRDAVYENFLAALVDGVTAHREPRDPVVRVAVLGGLFVRALRAPVGVVEVDVVVDLEVGVHRDPEEPALGVGAHGEV